MTHEMEIGGLKGLYRNLRAPQAYWGFCFMVSAFGDRFRVKVLLRLGRSSGQQ